MQITLPAFSLVLLVGPSGVGKSTFARKHFLQTEILSSDAFRAMLCDDENDQSVNRDAFDLLHQVLQRRLYHHRLTVVDATNVEARSREKVLNIAAQHRCPVVALVFDLPKEVCAQQNASRTERIVLPHVIDWHIRQLQENLPKLQEEGFAQIHMLTSPEEVAAITIAREPLPLDRRAEVGPFDIVGDVHGCYDELTELLRQLGYTTTMVGEGNPHVTLEHPEGRKLLFVGDLVDRGPKVPEVLRLVMDAVASGKALCVVGNHDDKLLRHLRGNPVSVSHGLKTTLDQLEAYNETFVARLQPFLEGLPSHYLLDEGRLVIAHAGLPEEFHGRTTKRIRDFALYGEVTGKKDEAGLPIRGDWGARYKGTARVVYGHTPIVEPTWVNGTMNIDTGCVFGGRLTALRYPEMELVSVVAKETYWEHGSAEETE